MGDNPVGMKVEVTEEWLNQEIRKVPSGIYEVYVGDWGWDDGDLYILLDSNRRVKLKDLIIGKREGRL